MRLEDLYKKYPFVYKLDEKYFFLGWGICKTCNSEMAIYYFEKYEELLQTIGEEKLESKEKELEDVKKKKLEVELINKGKTIDNEIDESEKVVTWEDILKDKIEID